MSNGLGGFLFLMACAIVGAVVYGLHEKQQLQESGASVKRDYDAIRTAHIYSSPIISLGIFWDAVNAFLPDKSGVEAQLKESGAVHFVSQRYGFAAVMEPLEDEGGEKRLRFSFVSWKDRNGMLSGAAEMLVLLTTVEKALLSKDPFVTVRRERMAIKTRSKLF